MPFSVRTDKEFAGPTLTELLPILEDIPDPVEARWSGSRQDFLAFEKCAARTLILVAPDNAVAERALWLLGGALELSKDDLVRWHKILAKKGWVAPSWPKEWGVMPPMCLALMTWLSLVLIQANPELCGFKNHGKGTGWLLLHHGT